MKTFYVKLLDLHKDCFYSEQKDLLGKIYRVEGSFYFPVGEKKYGYIFKKPKVRLLRDVSVLKEFNINISKEFLLGKSIDYLKAINYKRTD